MRRNSPGRMRRFSEGVGSLSRQAWAYVPYSYRCLRYWLPRYLWLVLIGGLVFAWVGFQALTSELGTVEWKLKRAVAVERTRQAELVRRINFMARWSNLQQVIQKRNLVRQPQGVIELDLSRPLPVERLTALTTPQPFRGEAAQPTYEMPTRAGLR